MKALLLAPLGILLLAGCVTTGGNKVNHKEAARANVQLGIAYLQRDDLRLAKEKLDRAARQDPDSVELHTAQAFLNERLNRPEDAERSYRAAQRLAPHSADVANNYAVFLCKNGRADEAMPLFESAAREPLYATPWAALTNGAVCLRSVRRGADAVAYLERAIGQRPDYAPAVVELADLQLELGQADRAAATVTRFLGIGRSAPGVLLVGVRAAVARGDQPAANEYARRLRRDYPDSAQAHMLPQLLKTSN